MKHIKSIKPRIYFYANLGDLSKPGYGGGEEGNRRTLSILNNSPFEAVIIPKYLKVSGRGLKKKIKLMWKMTHNYLAFLFKLIFGRRKDSIVHIVGFYGVMVFWEYLLAATARTLGYKTVYEMRGGGAEDFYRNGNDKYRKTFDKLIRNSVTIFSQGKENEPLLKEIDPFADIFYYPNYVMPEFLPDSLPSKPDDVINIVFFGRLNRTKHIETIVESAALIKEAVSLPINLTLIGNFEDDKYKAEINKRISELKINDIIRICPQCTHDELIKNLKDKHFYIFPSEEPREGHSNALTEAMAYGIIPISSAQGFSRSVIGYDDLIIDDISPQEFAAKIVNVTNKGRISDLSKKMYIRVRELYNYEKASVRFICKYNEIFKCIH